MLSGISHNTWKIQKMFSGECSSMVCGCAAPAIVDEGTVEACTRGVSHVIHGARV